MTPMKNLAAAAQSWVLVIINLRLQSGKNHIHIQRNKLLIITVLRPKVCPYGVCRGSGLCLGPVILGEVPLIRTTGNLLILALAPRL